MTSSFPLDGVFALAMRARGILLLSPEAEDA
jgi:hypothetical protein